MLGNQEKDKNELIASKAKLKVKELGKESERTIYGLYYSRVTSCSEGTFTSSYRESSHRRKGATCHIIYMVRIKF